eukprot:1498455-Prymnesium_polylepis.2
MTDTFPKCPFCRTGVQQFVELSGALVHVRARVRMLAIRISHCVAFCRADSTSDGGATEASSSVLPASSAPA